MSISKDLRIMQVLASSPAIIYTCRAGGDYAATFVSDNFSLRFGYRTDDFLNQPDFWRDHIHPDDRHEVFANYHKLFENGYHVHEYRFRKSDGTYLWIHDELQLICGDDGKPVEIVGSWLDITERKETESALAKSELLFKQFFHLNPIATVITDPSGTILMVNPAFVKASGLSEQEVLGKTSLELGFWKHPEHRERMVRAINEKGFISNLETKFYGVDGKLMTCLLSSRAIEYGGETRILNMLVDVTERREAEDALRSNERLFRDFFQSNPIATIISSPDGRIHRVNSAFEKTTGFPGEEVVGRTAQEMNFWRNPADRDYMVSELQKSGRLDNFESRFFGKDNRPMTCLISCRAFSQEGETRILSTVFDITEQREIEESVRKLEQAKRDFISIAAHELRTPLIAIIGYCELLENVDDIPVSGDRKQNYLDIIKTNAEVLNCLVDDLLDMGRIQVGRPLGIRKSATDYLELVEKVVASAKLKSSQHEFVIHKGENLPETIRVDAARMTQVLHNLLSNALKFSPQGGVISVAVKKERETISFSVADQGVGIDDCDVAKIFDQFYRGNPGDSRSKGLGLGLSIAKQIIDEHDGRIDILSQPGQGTRVTVCLPVE